MEVKEKILAMIEEEIAKYEKQENRLFNEGQYQLAEKCEAKCLALGILRKRINEEVK